MGLFARLSGDHPGQPGAPAAPVHDDSTPALRAKHAAVIAQINAAAGDLPPAGTVLGRRITDAVAAVLYRENVESLDPYARVTLNAMLGDYLPSAVRTYVAAAAAGHPDEPALIEQLQALHQAAAEVVAASQANDVQALQTQSTFLRTKFSGSDLDL